MEAKQGEFVANAPKFRYCKYFIREQDKILTLTN
jgi:hypothetical protein